MTIARITPEEACRLQGKGATFVDIRPAEEHAREKIPGGRNVPLDSVTAEALPEGPVIFHCRTGMRTASNADQLAAAAGDKPCYILEGGIDGWREAGQEVETDEATSGRPA